MKSVFIILGISILTSFSTAFASSLGTHKLAPACLEKVTALNETVAQSFASPQSAPAVTTSITVEDTIENLESMGSSEVKATVLVFANDVETGEKEEIFNFETSTTIMEFGSDCYTLQIKNFMLNER